VSWPRAQRISSLLYSPVMTDHVDPCSPRTPFGHQIVGSLGGTLIIPEHRRSNDVPDFVQANHAVLLRGDRDAVDVTDTARRLDRLAKRRLPDIRICLGAVRMRRSSMPDQCSGLEVVYHDLAGLSR
jgi:hypothetical protein